MRQWLACSVLALAGCGGLVPSDYPHRVVDADGETIFLEDIQAIVDDGSLSDDEKRAQLRELGLEDEEIIVALLEL